MLNGDGPLVVRGSASSAPESLLILAEHLGQLDYEAAEMRQDVVPAELDQNRVVPNMGDPFRRGVRWPMQSAAR